MKIFKKGQEVDLEKVALSPFSYSHQRGLLVLDSVCAFSTPYGPAIFRLKDHLKRFFNSADLINMSLPMSEEEAAQYIKKAVQKNNKPQCYIRPLAYYPEVTTDVIAQNKKVEFLIGIFPFPSHSEKSKKLKISSYYKPAPSSVPVEAKISSHYLNSALAKEEALACGYDEALFLDQEGCLAEAPTANVFIVKNNVLYTPLLGPILPGITRISVLQLARDLGYTVKEKKIKPTELFEADEVFLTSSAVDILPIVQVDKTSFKTGEVTNRLKDAFFDVIHGKNEKYFSWLTFCKTSVHDEIHR